MISSAGSPCRTNSRTRQRWRSSAGIQSQMSGGAGPNRFTYIEGRDDRAEAGAQAGGQAEGVAGYVRAVDRTQNPANRLRGRLADREQRTGFRARSAPSPNPASVIEAGPAVGAHYDQAGMGALRQIQYGIRRQPSTTRVSTAAAPSPSVDFTKSFRLCSASP